jgi:hypothetical protein
LTYSFLAGQTFDTPATNSSGIHGTTSIPGERSTFDPGFQDRVPETATESGLFPGKEQCIPGQSTSSGIPEETPASGPSASEEQVSGSEEGIGPQDPSVSAGPSSSSRPTPGPKTPFESLGKDLLGDPYEAMLKLIPPGRYKGRGRFSPVRFVDDMVRAIVEVKYTTFFSFFFLSLLPSY